VPSLPLLVTHITAEPAVLGKIAQMAGHGFLVTLERFLIFAHSASKLHNMTIGLKLRKR
jgi:uncharacterized membrane protein